MAVNGEDKGGEVSLRLLETIEAELRVEGASVLGIGVPPDPSPDRRAFLHRHGFRAVTQRVWSKEL